MSKFKVGDRVTWGGKKASYEIEAIVGGVVYFVKGSGEYLYDCEGIPVCPSTDIVNLEVGGEILSHAKPKSPVVEKTITVKSIEAGQFGIVSIRTCGETHFEIEIPEYRNPTADDLESAAHTFLELAKYLQEKEK